MIILKCLNDQCNCEFKGKHKEGLRCPKCGNPIYPLNINPTKEELDKVPTYKELKENPNIVNKKTWEEFRNSGLLWFANMILHTFGWSIVVSVEDDGTILNAYPARVKYRGFDTKFNTEGYQKVSEYMYENARQLERESKE